MVVVVVTVVATLFAQAAIRHADHSPGSCRAGVEIVIKHSIACISRGAGWARDLKGIVDVVVSTSSSETTGVVTIAAPILLDAGCGIFAGIIANAASIATCIWVGGIIAWS